MAGRDTEVERQRPRIQGRGIGTSYPERPHRIAPADSHDALFHLRHVTSARLLSPPT
ncbi:hypothetical protein [Streptomyces sp. AK010]|uniref:hypothetical protein n=1 Tax=Streptomyces sp. AK010 TaxID=2723074 RepID=UPI00160B4C7D|nr:hypothetical protein [Streptomyces sp. AK010]MBB6420869.1 hypothetical protein [Streptomyces sp. AK010]